MDPRDPRISNVSFSDDAVYEAVDLYEARIVVTADVVEARKIVAKAREEFDLIDAAYKNALSSAELYGLDKAALAAAKVELRGGTPTHPRFDSSCYWANDLLESVYKRLKNGYQVREIRAAHLNLLYGVYTMYGL